MSGDVGVVLSPAEQDTIIKELFAEDDSCAHNLMGMFDEIERIIAERVEAAKAEAWDEGHRLTAPHGDRCEPTCPNPYRAALDPEAT